MKIFKAKNYIKDGLSLHIFRSEKTTSEPIHGHDFLEIIFVIEGSASESVNDKVYEVSRGDLLFINYGSTHKFSPHGKFIFYNLCFDPEIIANRIITRENAFDLLSLTALDELRDGDSTETIMHFRGSERQTLEAILSDMYEEYNSDMSERAAVLESYMTVLIAKILRKASPEIHSANLDGRWQDLADFIDTNITKRLTLAELAKKCFYNPSYFSRAFKEHFGITLQDYIARTRADAAAEMLLTSGLSLDEIAVRSGFMEKARFVRAFSKFYGMTPSEYRENRSKK